MKPDDILTILMEGDHLACSDTCSPCVKCLAIKEIEQLREALATWKELAYRMYNSRGWLMPSKITREFDRAHYSDWTPEYKREFNKWLGDMNERLEARRES